MKAECLSDLANIFKNTANSHNYEKLDTDLDLHINKEKKEKNLLSNFVSDSNLSKGKTKFTSETDKKKELVDNTPGRIPNRLKGVKKGKHNYKSKDNSRAKLFTSCAKSLDDFIYKEVSKYKIKLHRLYIKNQLGQNLSENEKFFEKKIINIYFDSIPKRHTENNICYNKKNISLVLEKEMKDNNKKIKLLNILFDLEFGDIFKMFLYDIPYIIKDNMMNSDTVYKIYLMGFKTFKDQLTELDEDDKAQFKLNAKLFIEGKITHRKLRKKNSNF